MFQGEWMPQAQALKQLGISRTQFWRLRDAGLISAAHIYRAGPGPKARLWLNVEAIRLALQVRMARELSSSPPRLS